MSNRAVGDYFIGVSHGEVFVEERKSDSGLAAMAQEEVTDMGVNYVADLTGTESSASFFDAFKGIVVGLNIILFELDHGNGYENWTDSGYEKWILFVWFWWFYCREL